MPTSAMRTSRPIIALEEHFLSAAASRLDDARLAGFKAVPDFFEQFTDLGPRRLADMDSGHVTMQVISHAPGDLSAEACRECNDQLAAAVRRQTGRFAGFAELPMHDPEATARELERACGRVDDDEKGGGGLGFAGALVDSHTDAGQYYDGPAYDVVWAAATRLDVPIYIHPTWPTPADIGTARTRSPHLADDVNTAILAFGFGWHSDVAMHLLRLYASGVFERFPALKIIIGHMGEMIPYMLQRIERVTARWGPTTGQTGQTTRSFRAVWDTNVWLTTSGNWSLDPLACILRNTLHDRILYSVDYPFAKSRDGLAWLDELAGSSGMVTAYELEGIRWRNAARLLKLDEAALLAASAAEVPDDSHAG